MNVISGWSDLPAVTHCEHAILRSLSPAMPAMPSTLNSVFAESVGVDCSGKPVQLNLLRWIPFQASVPSS